MIINYTEDIRKLAEQVEIDPWWICGFTAGEGTFDIGISPDSSYQIGYRVKVNFSLCTISTNQHVLWAIRNYFNAGNVTSGGRNMARYQLGGTYNAVNIVIPFFDKYNILGNKALDYADYRKAAFIIHNKEHLTIDGLNKIRILKEGMNTNRDYTKYKSMIP